MAHFVATALEFLAATPVTCVARPQSRAIMR